MVYMKSISGFRFIFTFLLNYKILDWFNLIDSSSVPHIRRYGLPAVNEMLSSAGCLRALSLVHKSSGDLHTYREALNVLLSSLRYCLHSLYNAFCRYKLLLNVLFLVSLHLKCLISFTIHSYAEKAENPALCVAAARHYWNTCLPLTHTPEERWQLKQPLENILTALLHTNAKHANVWTLYKPQLHCNPHIFAFLLVPCVSRGRSCCSMMLTQLRERCSVIGHQVKM